MEEEIEDRGVVNVLDLAEGPVVPGPSRMVRSARTEATEENAQAEEA